MLDKVRAQARDQGLYQPLASEGAYYAYLSKVDQTEKGWYVFFELLDKRLLDVALFERGTYVPGSPPPRVPILIFDVANAEEKALLSTLEIPTADDLAEGSWFELELKSGPGPVEGNLYDATIDLPPTG